MNDKRAIGEKIKYLLDSQGKLAKDLAIELDVTQAAMSNYLSGKRDINVNMIGKIANFLNVSTDTLLLDVDTKTIKLGNREKLLLNSFNNMSKEKQDAYLKLFELENKKEK